MLKTSAEAVFAYAGIRHRTTELLADLSDGDAGATVVPACPAWSVTDVVAHLYGVQRDILDGNLEGVATEPWADNQVRRFAPLGLHELVGRWNETSPELEKVAGGFPPRVAAQLVFDACTHEHDVRGALDRPGGRDVDSVIIGMTFIERWMQSIVDDRGLAGIELGSPLFETTIGPEPTGVRLTTSTFELFRTFAGRRATSQIDALPWDGDPTPYLAILSDGPVRPPDLPLFE
jgi:uncharacterized protein (TIGR03083 family)